MKKAILLLIMSISGLYLSAQENRTWRLGLQWGGYNNHAKFSGGSSNANARFFQNQYDGGSFDLVARYDLNQHWMATTGMGFNTFGFGYALAENYSLLNLKNRFSTIRSEFTAFEIPFMVFYKFNLNCKNTRWLIGGGFAADFTDGKTVSKNFVQSTEGISTSNYLNSVSSSNSGGHAMLRFAIGREKVFKRGAMLNASLVFNTGLSQIAASTVNYTVDGQSYSHSFSNKGNYAGLRLTYYFRANAFKNKTKTQTKGSRQNSTTIAK
ncbi:MAG: hypothetical protein ABIP51_14165 [Bacteroidia bacterium]